MIRISVKKVHKEFDVNLKDKKFFQKILLLLKRNFSKKIKHVALDDVSFDIKKGELVGFIGKNGSGKTTLLRLIAGIHKIYDGEIGVNGKLTSIINLAIGLNPRLTLVENTFLVGSLFDMSYSEIKQKLDSIIEFAELEEYRDTKLYQFSQGMKVRLAVSIVFHTEPEILLADEIFATVDEGFKNKVQKKLKEMTDNGGSVILVSHRLDLLEENCNRIIWLENGVIKKDGNSKEVLSAYRLLNGLE